MSPRQREQSNRPMSAGRAVALTAALGIVAVVIGLGALGIALTRTAAPDDCQATAWNAVPEADLLPSGWSMVTNRVFVDNLTTTLVGPVPSGSTQRPAVYVSLSCYGNDASLALRRAREGALAAGATDVALADLGDESLAVTSTSSGTTTVYVRRGDLVAELTAPATLDQATLSAMGQTVDAAMVHALAAGPAGSPLPQPSRAPATTAASPGPTPMPSPTPSHLVPDLEALLPHTVGTTTLSTQSILGTTALDPASAASQSLIASLQTLGKAPADLEIAGAYDPTGALDLRLFAYRVKGVAPSALGPAIIASQMTNTAAEPATSEVTVGGHPMTKITYASGTPVYIYDLNGVVYAIATSDESIAASVVGLLR